MARFRRRSRVERLRDRGDVRRLVRRLGAHEWLPARDGRAIDLAVADRLEAVAALGQIGTEEAERGVIIAFADSDIRVRHAAIEALRPAPRPATLRAVAHAAARWRDPALGELREAAVELLADTGDEASAIAYTQVLVDDPERRMLDDWEQDAVARLFATDTGPAAEALAGDLAERLPRDDDDARRAWQALVAMGAVAVEPLVAALDDAACRPAAADALGAVRDARAVDPLTCVLADGDPRARAAAARALGAIRDPRAVQALVTASADADPDVRDAAMDGLDRMRSVVLAMLGAATAEPAGASDDQRPGVAVVERAGLRLPQGVDSRSLARRLLDWQP